MAAALEAVQSGEPTKLTRLLVGRRIWAVAPEQSRPNPDTGGNWSVPASAVGPVRVLSLKAFLPADPPHRKLHLVQLWTDPGGMRTLAVGAIRLKDPGRSAGAKRRADREARELEDDD